ncbi:hypothetical protein FJT64_002032 [Amphibalanus amphitrite]|uniref:Uncharacterized protein n=1 Tax=Amphibalanus amphitrite TaxID=1232801 RepID=A0A6A4X5H6_AMPAM|nr:protein crumbs homolog 2-like [Amphibalanus amphitrite]XP_043245917.1 protein crumbs homolog 2-like [Amphibalanus amphitrite]KAF0310178.1 hypothetical protein FJT64_002032 [Amphibalanus amphitrite]
MLLWTVLGVFAACGLSAARSPALCVNQPCHPPNRCEDRGQGVSVCVLPSPPTCAATSCLVGFDCVLQQQTCRYRPCKPQPTCIQQGTNPCGLCIAPNEFCELQPADGSPPTCRFVVEPRCDNKRCRYGEQCVEKQLACIRAPCALDLQCRRQCGSYGQRG